MSRTLEAIGIDIGVTNVKSMRVGEHGSIVAQETTATDSGDAAWPSRVREHIEKLEQAHGRAKAIGVAAPGIADPSGTHISWMQGRLAQVQGLNWTEFLRRERLVPVLNDAQAALLGEVWRGAAVDKSNVMLLTLGTGVGGAAMVDGKLLKGHLGRAGHLGHICLDMHAPRDITNTPGSLEYFVGDYSLAQRAACGFASTIDVALAHEKQDPRASKLWNDMIHALACGIASLINVLDPQTVIIGGGIATAGAMLFDPLRAELDRLEWRPHNSRVTIVPAQLGEYAGAYGAAWNAMQQENP